jgi:uncharacterized membrane protein
VSIKRKLQEWQAAGLLDDEQATKIARYEEQHASSASWAVWGISAVGALAIAAGIISVIAANWDDIPARLKLAVCAVLLLATLAGAWRTAERASSRLRDLCLFLHDGMVLASVGLVAQVYHLHGHPWRAFALCAVLGSVPAAIAAHSLLTDVVLAHLTLALGFLLGDAGWFDHFDHDFAVGFFAASLGLVFAFAARLARAVRPAAATALRRWSAALIGIVAVASCVLWNENSRYTAQVYWPIWIFALAVIGLVTRELASDEPGRNARLLAIALLFALLAGAALTHAASDHAFRVPRQLVGFALFCAFCAAVAIAAAQAGDKLGTNLATLALAGRVLGLYFELAKDLMTTGVGLIATGGVCLLVAYGWWRLRRALPIAEAT